MGPFLGVPDYGLRAGGCLDLSGAIPESCRIFARPLNLDSQSARGIFPSPVSAMLLLDMVRYVG